jgi:hypothetical protein
MMPDARFVDHLVTEAFDFLERRLGATREVNHGSAVTAVAYVAAPLSVEIALEWRERVVFLLLCHSPDGRRPGGYYVDAGRLVRVYLAEALERLGIQDPATTAKLRGMRAGREPVPTDEQIVVLAGALAEHLDVIVAGHDRIFTTTSR